MDSNPDQQVSQTTEDLQQDKSPTSSNQPSSSDSSKQQSVGNQRAPLPLRPLLVSTYIDSLLTKSHQTVTTPVLRWTPTAWSSLVRLREELDTEIGMYGVTGTTDPFLITDLWVPRQQVGAASVSVEDSAICDMDLRAEAAGLERWQWERVWIHTHPKGMGPGPSGVDESDWRDKVGLYGSKRDYLMVIVGAGPQVYCRWWTAARGLVVELTSELVMVAQPSDDWAQTARSQLTEHRWSNSTPAVYTGPTDSSNNQYGRILPYGNDGWEDDDLHVSVRATFPPDWWKETMSEWNQFLTDYGLLYTPGTGGAIDMEANIEWDEADVRQMASEWLEEVTKKEVGS